MLTWGIMLAIAGGVYAQRAFGALVIDTSRLHPAIRRFLDSLPLAIITAVVALATFTEAGELTFNPRMVGVGVAAVCAWRRLPMLVIVIAAAAATALARAVAG